MSDELGDDDQVIEIEEDFRKRVRRPQHPNDPARPIPQTGPTRRSPFPRTQVDHSDRSNEKFSERVHKRRDLFSLFSLSPSPRSSRGVPIGYKNEEGESHRGPDDPLGPIKR